MWLIRWPAVRCLLLIYLFGWLFSAMAETVGRPWDWTDVGRIVPPFVFLIVHAALKHRELARWWRAWNEKGQPIEVEVLPPAKVTRQ